MCRLICLVGVKWLCLWMNEQAFHPSALDPEACAGTITPWTVERESAQCKLVELVHPNFVPSGKIAVVCSVAVGVLPHHDLPMLSQVRFWSF